MTRPAKPALRLTRWRLAGVALLAVAAVLGPLATLAIPHFWVWVLMLPPLSTWPWR